MRNPEVTEALWLVQGHISPSASATTKLPAQPHGHSASSPFRSRTWESRSGHIPPARVGQGAEGWTSSLYLRVPLAPWLSAQRRSWCLLSTFPKHRLDTGSRPRFWLGRSGGQRWCRCHAHRPHGSQRSGVVALIRETPCEESQWTPAPESGQEGGGPSLPPLLPKHRAACSSQCPAPWLHLPPMLGRPYPAPEPSDGSKANPLMLSFSRVGGGELNRAQLHSCPSGLSQPRAAHPWPHTSAGGKRPRRRAGAVKTAKGRPEPGAGIPLRQQPLPMRWTLPARADNGQTPALQVLADPSQLLHPVVQEEGLGKQIDIPNSCVGRD